MGKIEIYTRKEPEVKKVTVADDFREWWVVKFETITDNPTLTIDEIL